MAALPFWAGSDTDAAAWNSVQLGDALIPGLCTVTADAGRQLDEQKSQGTDGAYLVDHGDVLGTVTINVLLFTSDHWTAWQNVLPKIKQAKRGGSRSPLQILHPEANLLGINTVYVKKIRGAPPSSKSGKAYTIECVEWVPKPKTPKVSKTPRTTQTPLAAGSGAAGGINLILPPDIGKSF